MRIAALITCLGIAALAVSGCGGTTTADKTTVTETVSASATPSTSASASTSASPSVASSPGLAKPPAGASQLETESDDGVVFARYSIDGQQPQQVVD